MMVPSSLRRRIVPGVALTGTIVLLLTGCFGGAPGTPGGDEPTGGVVRGQVTTVHGTPVPGAEVFADNVQFYNTNITAITDDAGYYEIKLDDTHAGPWRVGGYKAVSIDGATVKMALHVTSDEDFLTSEGAVRNLEWRLSGSTVEGGHYGSNVWVYSDLSSDEVPTDQVELTLTPVGPLVDGSTGEALVSTPTIHRIGDVPLGTYVASARYVDGSDSTELLIRLRDTGSPSSSVTTSFWLSAYDKPHIELEVSRP